MVEATMFQDDTTTEIPDTQSSPCTLARKRRIELRNQQRAANGGTGSNDSVVSESSTCAKRQRVDHPSSESVTSSGRAEPSITGIKNQHRYDPGVSMTREELKAWRKEARRVRNRESAAASRRRNRDRVEELESEVDALKSKYAAALQRIVELEAANAVNHSSFSPAILRQDLQDLMSSSEDVPRPSSPPRVDTFVTTVSPPASPTTSSRLVEMELCSQEVGKKYQHLIRNISQPAVFT